MSTSPKKTWKALCFSIAIAAATAIAASAFVSDAAYAKGGKGAEKSSSKGGNGKAKSNGSGNRSKTTSGAAKKPAVEPKAKKAHGNKVALALGVHPSELGALNAANANPNAWANASPNSRVGKINLYFEAVKAGKLLQEELDQAQMDLDSLVPPTPTAPSIADDLEAALATNPVDDALVEQLTSDLDAAEKSDAAEQDVYDKALIAADAEVDRLEDAAEEQMALETGLLADAANKPVSQNLEDAFKTWLLSL